VATEQPALFWGIIASMWVGNLFLLALNLPMIGLWVRLLAVPYRLLFPAILVFCCIGVFTINNNVFALFPFVVFSGPGSRLPQPGGTTRAGDPPDPRAPKALPPAPV